MKSSERDSLVNNNVLVRFVNCIRENGVIYSVKYACRLTGNIIKFGFQKQKYLQILNAIEPKNRVFIWTEYFGWNISLFQRPQHIARCLAEHGNTVFYYTTPDHDPNVKEIEELYPNLFLVNRNNVVLISLLENYLENVNKKKYIHTYSTLGTTVDEIKRFEEKGFSILYEYVDDLSPELSGGKDVPEYLLDKYDYVMKDNHIPVVVTADLLKDQVISLRGRKNLVQSSNGVDIKHFRNIESNYPYNEQFRKIIEKGNKIIGYYGALAQWLDYDLLKFAAEMLPNIEFVLIGKIYDESFSKAEMDGIPNIHFIGPVSYQYLPQYANKFDVCTIPFKVNSVTNATSPLKLFEYMALNKPVLTTAMKESSKYKAVNIANNYEEFVNKATMLLDYTPENEPEYFTLLNETVEQNTWKAKTELILDMLDKYENNHSSM